MRIDRSQPQYYISTEEDSNTPWRQVSLGTRMVHQQRQMPSKFIGHVIKSPHFDYNESDLI